MQNNLTTTSEDTLHKRGTANSAPSDRLRVLLVDESQPLLDSLHRWLSYTYTVKIVAKITEPVSALTMWESMKPEVIVLSAPHATGAIAACAKMVLAVKALYPQVKIVLLAWDRPNMDRESLAELVKLVDAWVFKQTVCQALLPTLSILFPNRILLHSELAPCTTLWATGEDYRLPDLK